MAKVNRRQHGEGSVYQRADGRCVAVEDLGMRGGKRDRRYFYGDTRDEAMKKRERFRDRRRDGFTLPKGRQPTVAEWIEHWFHGTCKRKVEETTWQGYKSKVELWMVPFFSDIKLPDLSGEDIEDWHAWLESRVSPKTKRPLSASTIGQTHRILSECITLAVVRKRLHWNPVPAITPPSAEEIEIVPPTVAEVKQIIARCATWPSGARWVLGITTGLRQGEILGLEWPQVKLDAERPHVVVIRSAARVQGKGRVVKTPKSASSRRSVPLSPEAVTALRDLKARVQVHELRGDVLFRGSKLGRPLHPGVDYKDWHALLDDLKIRHYRPHDIRHGYATMLLEQGVPERVVGELMGWSPSAVVQLMKRYAHVRETMHRAAADAISRAISG